MFLKWMIMFFFGLIGLVNGASERAFSRYEKVKFEDGQCVSKEFGKIKPGGYANNDNECKQAFCYPPDEDDGLTASIHINDCAAEITCGVTKKDPGHFPDCCPYNDPDNCRELSEVPLK